MTAAEYRALMIRSEALNKLYGNAVTRLSPGTFAALYKAGGSRMTPEELNALVVRSQALNKQYGNAVTRLSAKQFAALYNAGASRMTPAELNALVVRSQGLEKLAASGVYMPPAVASSSPFAWGDFGIGVAAALGSVLLIGGIAVAARSGRRTRVAARIG